MKALLRWALIALIIVLILMIALLTPWSDLLEEAIRTSAQIHATQIAGIINLLQSSPNKTTHTYALPKAECNLSIGKRVVFTIDENRAFADVISLLEIEPKIIECSEEERIIIDFVRDGNMIKVIKVV